MFYCSVYHQGSEEMQIVGTWQPQWNFSFFRVHQERKTMPTMRTKQYS